MTFRKRRLIFKCIRAFVIATILAVVICEIGLRIAVGSISTPDRFPTLSQLSYDMNFDGFWEARDFHSSDLNITNNERFTTDWPVTYTRQVWLFGSSTVWGLFVPDRATIASALQREFNQRGIPWRVRNMGQSNQDVVSELYWLKHAATHKGDIIISFDGALDYLTAYPKMIKLD